MRRTARIRMYQAAEDILPCDAPWAYMDTPLNIFVTQQYVRDWVAGRESHRRSLGALAAVATPFTPVGVR